jgi:hypothetical protein
LCANEPGVTGAPARLHIVPPLAQILDYRQREVLVGIQDLLDAEDYREALAQWELDGRKTVALETVRIHCKGGSRQSMFRCLARCEVPMPEQAALSAKVPWI